jgi:hypothetical protein
MNCPLTCSLRRRAGKKVLPNRIETAEIAAAAMNAVRGGKSVVHGGKSAVRRAKNAIAIRARLAIRWRRAIRSVDRGGKNPNAAPRGPAAHLAGDLATA